ncbi:hypothetical protein E2C01_010750 [Portunus trituberculatus]|uniref:Uncharacterized protein n=1 Tax=Portunus trituberculatus TaxID=210409 RepID=A0A5B7D994_PORTR|nr:hypothetical protein [Portunus trituberculatus]
MDSGHPDSVKPQGVHKKISRVCEEALLLHVYRVQIKILHWRRGEGWTEKGELEKKNEGGFGRWGGKVWCESLQICHV